MTHLFKEIKPSNIFKICFIFFNETNSKIVSFSFCHYSRAFLIVVQYIVYYIEKYIPGSRDFYIHFPQSLDFFFHGIYINPTPVPRDLESFTENQTSVASKLRLLGGNIPQTDRLKVLFYIIQIDDR